MAADPQRACKLLARWYFGVGMGEKAVRLCARQDFDQQEIRAMEVKGHEGRSGASS